MISIQTVKRPLSIALSQHLHLPVNIPQRNHCLHMFHFHNKKCNNNDKLSQGIKSLHHTAAGATTSSSSKQQCYFHSCNIALLTLPSSAPTHASRKDPTAKRPNKICDPYGQNGKPITRSEAGNQLTLLDAGWQLGDDFNNSQNHDQKDDNENNNYNAPRYLYKQFYHSNYIDASKFANIIASVAHNNNHFPSIQIKRQLMKKEKAWRVVSTVTCHTEVLDGLSFNDFHIAMLIDVEVGRGDVKCLTLSEEDSLRKQ